MRLKWTRLRLFQIHAASIVRNRTRPVAENAKNADIFRQHVQHVHHVAFAFDRRIEGLVVIAVVAVSEYSRALQRPGDDIESG